MSSIPLRAATHAAEYAGWLAIPLAASALFLPSTDDADGSIFTKRNALIAAGGVLTAGAAYGALRTGLSVRNLARDGAALVGKGRADTAALARLRDIPLARVTEGPIPALKKLVHSTRSLTTTAQPHLNFSGAYQGPVFTDGGKNWDAAVKLAHHRSSHSLVGQAQAIVQPAKGGNFYITQLGAAATKGGTPDQAVSLMPFFFSGRHTTQIDRMAPQVKAVVSKWGFADLREAATSVRHAVPK